MDTVLSLDSPAVRRRRQELNRWSSRGLIVLAWTLAALRVCAAAARHAVFDVEDTLAFVVMVMMPLFGAETIASVTRSIGRALQRMRTAIFRTS